MKYYSLIKICDTIKKEEEEERLILSQLIEGIMGPFQKIVISASRRTDIPAFYLDWFMERIERGFFEVQNPNSRQISLVPAKPEKVHTIVFWSKNFGPFLQGQYGQKLTEMGFHLFFNFTINSEDAILEPRISPLKTRFEQVQTLAQEFGAETISWRFDPICFYQDQKGLLHNNLHDFERIADKLSSIGIKRCITSFMDDYSKIRKRVRAKPGFAFIYPSIEEQIPILLKMEKTLTRISIQLFTCCEKEVLSSLPAHSHIKASSCIPNDLLQRLFGGNISLAHDYGQRREKGCGCRASRDIGSYINQPCKHNCLYCYANPTMR